MPDDMKYSIPKLDSDNYQLWALKITSLLKLKSCWAAVDAPDVATAEQKDKAMSLLCLNVTDHVLLTVCADSATAADLWQALKAHFQSRALAQQIVLRRKFNSVKKLASETLLQYLARVKTLVAELKAAGSTLADSDVCIQFLDGLPKSYDTVATILQTSSAADLKLDLMYEKLLPFEQKLGKDPDDQALVVQSSRTKQQSGRSGSSAPRSGSSASGSKPIAAGSGAYATGSGGSGTGRQLICHYCSKPGHIRRHCKKRLADLAKKSSGAGNAVALTVAESPDLGSTVYWILDSGATRHMCNDVAFFLELQPLPDPVPVKVGSGTSVSATSIGTVQLRPGVTLRDVYFVPDLDYNLMSVKRATTSGAEIKFDSTRGVVSIAGRQILTAIAGEDGLYRFPVSDAPCALVHRAECTPQLWHRRFAHLGYDSMQRLVSGKLVTGLDARSAEIQAAKSQLCEPCVLSKQPRSSFPPSDSIASDPLDLVHMDVCGPITPSSLGGSRYFCTFLDDFTKYSVVKAVAHKSDVPDIVRTVLSQLEVVAGRRVKSVRSDRGGEYTAGRLQDFFNSKGILHQTTAPYTPEQNGRAERLNRTLLERVRTLLVESKLDRSLWAEALHTVNYLRNRSPATGRTRTPFELLYGSVPDVSHLRVFGCTAYPHVPKIHRSKLDPVSVKGVFVGYEAASKAYRVYLPDLKKIVVSASVTFNEAVTAVVPDPDPDEFQFDLSDSDQEEFPPVPVPIPAPVPAALPPGDHGIIPASAAAPPVQPPEPRYPSRQRNAPGNWWEVPRSENAAVVTAGVDISEPQSYAAALSGEHAEQWQKAMDEEMASLLSLQTWELSELPPGRKALPVKWVYKVKRDPNGNLERFKARLVVKGFKQRPGIDYGEVFAPVSKHTTFRTLMGFVALRDLELHHLDIKTAFLNGVLEEELWMEQPEGYKQGDGKLACRLLKSLYGLKQSPRCWHTRLKSELESYGFVQSVADPGLFILSLSDDTVFVLMYVDDLLVAAKLMHNVNTVKAKLRKSFDCRDLGEATQFLNIHITRDRKCGALKITQHLATSELVSKFGLDSAHARKVPLTPGTMLRSEGEPLDTVKYPYAELVGSLLYLTVCTRPDLAQSVGVLSRYMSKPTMQHWQAAKGVLRYAAGTVNMGIVYRSDAADELQSYCDSDYAGDLDSRRSTTGYVFILAGGAIAWNSKLQPTVAASTVEAEYMAASGATKEALWLRMLLNDFGLNISTIRIWCDNQGCLRVTDNPVLSVRSKHIDVMHHFVRDRVNRKEVKFDYCNTESMLADCFTKAVPAPKLLKCRIGCGLSDASL